MTGRPLSVLGGGWKAVILAIAMSSGRHEHAGLSGVLLTLVISVKTALVCRRSRSLELRLIIDRS